LCKLLGATRKNEFKLSFFSVSLAVILAEGMAMALTWYPSLINQMTFRQTMGWLFDEK
jgi:hypothetical protein